MIQTTGLILLYIVSFYVVYKIFQPDIEGAMKKLKQLKGTSLKKIKK